MSSTAVFVFRYFGLTCLAEVLCDVNALSVGQSSRHRRPGRRGHRGVDGIDVVAQVNRFLCSVHVTAAFVRIHVEKHNPK